LSVCEVLVRAAAAVDAEDNLCAVFLSVLQKTHARLVSPRSFSHATPLHGAALNGHDDVCRFLVRAAADPLATTRCAAAAAAPSALALPPNQANTPRCSDGRTPLQWAVYNRKLNTVAYLQSLDTTQSA
jgi:ankyrin repeat protein